MIGQTLAQGGRVSAKINVRTRRGRRAVATRSRAVLLRQAELAGVGLAFVAALVFVAAAFGNVDALFAGI